MIDDPRAVEVRCPACQARAGERCSAPTDTGRRPVRWFHLARTTLLADTLNGRQ